MISTERERSSRGPPWRWPSVGSGLPGLRTCCIRSLPRVAMTDSIVYVDRSAITSADLAGLRKAVSDLVDFVRHQEPQLLFYGFEIDAAGGSMSVVAVHPDSASLELHLRVGGPEFAKVGAYIELRSIDVYGVPSETAIQQLDAKARTMGRGVPVVVHELSSSFS